MKKTALIVDDSKSARFVLKRMLETHELDVDTAESAETALDYLNDHRPDVIFMDHLMPGMDGFEAVSAIKKNPVTATIPIMMYTSQKGEVYVGQARALGAVGVLPKQVEPVEVSKVLQSLRVIDGDKESRAAVKEVDENETELPELAGYDDGLRELIKDLFDQQRAILRRDLLDSYEAIAARVADELKSQDSSEPKTQTDAADKLLPGVLQAAVAALIVVAIIFAWLYWQRELGWQEARRQNTNLMQALERQQSIDAQSVIETQRRLDSYQQSIGATFLTALDAVEWGINQNARIGFDELPLSDARLPQFKEATTRLINLGFAGEVLIETHAGEFCLIDSGAAGMQLAPGGLDAAECDQINTDSLGTLEPAAQQSLSFANFINVTEEQSQGGIRFNVVSMGAGAPIATYPAISAVSARMWNEIAAANNRLVVTLIPDAG